MKTGRNQITANKPGEPYQKSHPQTQHNPLITQPASLDTSGHTLPQHKSTLRTSKVEVFPSYLNPCLPNPLWDEQRSLYSSTTAPFWSSSPSPHYLSAGAFSTPNLRNFSPLQISLPTSTLIQSPHMGLGLQSTLMISLDGSHWETQFHGSVDLIPCAGTIMIFSGDSRLNHQAVLLPQHLTHMIYLLCDWCTDQNKSTITKLLLQEIQVEAISIRILRIAWFMHPHIIPLPAARLVGGHLIFIFCLTAFLVVGLTLEDNVCLSALHLIQSLSQPCVHFACLCNNTTEAGCHAFHLLGSTLRWT